MGSAFEITEDDVIAVLRKNWDRIVNTNGKSFSAMAATLYNNLDTDRVEKAALMGGGDMDDQITAVHNEIERALTEDGVLAAPKALPFTVVLLRPEYLSKDTGEAYGEDIYVATVTAGHADAAIAAAQNEAFDADKKDELVPESPADYKLCVMFEGHHEPKLFGWQANVPLRMRKPGIATCRPRG